MLKQITSRRPPVAGAPMRGFIRRPKLNQHEIHHQQSNPPGTERRNVAHRQRPTRSPSPEHYPHFTDQAAVFGGKVGLFRLPIIPNIYYFNPSLVDYMGQRWVTFRRSYFDYGPWQNYRTTISMFPVNPRTMELGGEYELAWPKRHPMEQTDDPRTAIINGKLTLGVCAWKTPKDKSPVIVHQSLAEFEGMQVKSILDVPYRGNGKGLFDGTSMEKNWLWFEHDHQLHFVYQATPMTVCRVEGGYVAQTHETHTTLDWNYGTIRGGTPPVRVGDQYVTFFHSSVPWRPMPSVGMRNRYYMGCLTFDAAPPFKIRSYTKNFMMGGTFAEPTIRLAPPCIFPAGALLDDGIWTIVYGINDCTGGWLKVSHEDVLKLMTKCD